jgi:endonuclease/exonuclease/phosphatase family metal-dependent hydrolase
MSELSYNIFMVNVAKSVPRTKTILNMVAAEVDVVMMQEVQMVKTGTMADGETDSSTPIMGFTKDVGWDMFHHPCPKIDGARGPRAVMYVRRGVKGVVFRPDLVSHPDVVVVSMPELFLVNIYNAGPKPNDNALQALTQLDLHWVSAKVVIGGDFNLHHPLWEPHQKNRRHISQATQFLVDWMADMELDVANNPGTQTRPSSNSVLDLVILNAASDVTNLHVLNKEEGLFSNHLPILFSVAQNPFTEGATQDSFPGWLIKLDN